MKISQLKEIVKKVVSEETEYQQLFVHMLDKTGKDIGSMSDDETTKFFNAVDRAYKAKSEGKLRGYNENVSFKSVNEVTLRKGTKIRTYVNGKSDIVDYVLEKPNHYNAIKGGKTNLFKVINSTNSEVKVGSTQEFSTSDLKGMIKHHIASVLESKSVNEGRYDADLDKIEAAVKNATSFMNVGAELKKAGIKYDFSTSMIPMYRIKVSGSIIAILNKKYASGAEREVNGIAIGIMENVIKESLSPEVAKHMGSIHKGFKMVEDDGAMVYDSPTNAKKAADFLNSKKIAASFDGKYVYLESVNEAFKHTIHVDTPTQIVSKSIAAQIRALAKKGVRSKEIGLEMGFTGDAKLAADTFQKVKNKIYFELDTKESVKEIAQKKK